MMLRNQCGLPLLVALGLLVSACGGDDGDSETTETGTATDEAGTDEVGTTEAGDTVGTTTADTTTDAETTAETTDAETTDAETTGVDTTDAGTTDAETGGAACGDIMDADACTAMAGCQPVNGSRLKQNGPDAPCLEPEEFLGCIPEQACGDALTWFCQGNGTFQVNDTCGPEGADPCDGPADPVSACP